MTVALDALRRLLSRSAAEDRSSLRAGGNPYAVAPGTPGVWVALS